MKKLIPNLAAVVVVIATIVGVTVIRPAKGDAVPRRHEFVVLSAQEYYDVYGSNGMTTGYQWQGLYVYNYDASTGAPKLTLPVITGAYTVTTNKLAQTLADLGDQGLSLFWTDGRTFVLQGVR